MVAEDKGDEKKSQELVGGGIQHIREEQNRVEGTDTGNKEIKRKIGNIVHAELPEEIEKICGELKEDNKHLMKLVHDALGLEKVKVILGKTWEIEKGEGLWTTDKSRRKTPGGVFFQLAKDEIGKEKFNLMVKENQRERKKKRRTSEEASTK